MSWTTTPPTKPGLYQFQPTDVDHRARWCRVFLSKDLRRLSYSYYAEDMSIVLSSPHDIPGAYLQVEAAFPYVPPKPPYDVEIFHAKHKEDGSERWLYKIGDRFLAFGPSGSGPHNLVSYWDDSIHGTYVDITPYSPPEKTNAQVHD